MLLLAGFSACGSRHSAVRGAAQPQQPSLLGTLEKAHFLRAGGFKISALDAASNDDPLSLRFITAVASANELRISSLAGAPSSLYLYIRLPEGYSAGEISVGAPPSILAIAVPGKLPGIVPVGIAAIGGASGAGFTFRLAVHPQGSADAQPPCAFQGSQRLELPLKSANRPFETLATRVQDLEVTANGTYADLQWTEVNTGDYNNSGDVSVADITPLAMHFNLLADTPERELVDGNEDGKLDIKDITQIAMNFGSEITGYEVSALEIPSVDYEPSDDEMFAAVPFSDPDTPGEPRPSVKRAKFYVGGVPPKARIRYSFGWNMNAESYAFAVRAYSLESDDYAAVFFSNIAKAAFTTGGNSAPSWVSVPGLQAAVGGNRKVTLTFGDASDPDGDAIHYVVYWEQNTTVYPPAAQFQRFDRSALGQPPFSVDITGLENGLIYTFLVWVYDEHGLRENPPNLRMLSSTPYDYVSNPYPWPYLHKDEQRSGILAEALREPLVERWNKPYKVSGTYNESSPVLDAANAYIGSNDGRIYAFRQDDGWPIYSEIVAGFLSSSTAALWENRLVIGGPGKYYLRQLSDGAASGEFDLVSGLPVRSSALIVNGTAYAGSEEGIAYAFDILTGEEKWKNNLQSGAISSSPASDGTFIYVASQNGFVHKLDIQTGAEVSKSIDLGTITFATPVLFPAEAPIVVVIGSDTVAGNSKYYSLAASNLQVATIYPTDHGVQGAPVVVNDGARNLVIAGQGTNAPPSGYISAHDLVTGVQIWRTADVGRIFASPAASANRIFVGSVNGHFYVLDFQGNIKQDINLGSPIYASAALSGGRVFIPTTEMRLFCLEAQADTIPPTWQGAEGVRAVSTGFGEAYIYWDYATDNFYNPVYYSVYASTNKAQLWDGPPAASIRGSGAVTHSCTIPGLQDGVRYYFGVRASDRPLWDSPNTEQNVNIVGATPPWNIRAQLSLGSELPAAPGSYITYLDTAQSQADGALRLAYAVEGAVNRLRYVTYDGSSVTADGPIVPPDGVVRCLEMGEDDSGVPMLSFSDSANYILAVRDISGVWNSDTISAYGVPSQPAFSTFYGGIARMQALFAESVPLPNETVSLRSRLGDLMSWDSFGVADPDLDKGIHLRAAIADFGSGGIPMVFYQRTAEYYGGSTLPKKGSLWMAHYDSVFSEWKVSGLDTGSSIDSNTGRNLQLLLDSSTFPPTVHFVYYDLHASDVVDLACLRRATYDGAAFTAEDVMPVSLPNPDGAASAYYHDPALAIVDGHIALASYSRLTDPPTPSNPLNYNDVYYCRWNTGSGSWVAEKVVESMPVFLHFRAPLGLEVCPAVSDYPLLIMPVDPDGPLDGAKAIQIWQRGPLF